MSRIIRISPDICFERNNKNGRHFLSLLFCGIESILFAEE